MTEGEHDVEPIVDAMEMADGALAVSATAADVTDAPDEAPVTTSAFVVPPERVPRKPAARKAKARTNTRKAAKAKAKAQANAKSLAKATLEAAASKKPRMKRARKVQQVMKPKQDIKANVIGSLAPAPAAAGTGLVRLGSAGFAVWLDAAVAAALTDKDRKRLQKVLKRAAKRGKKR